MTTGAASSELADALRSALAACPEPTDEPVLLLAALPNLQASPAARQLLHRHAVAVIGSRGGRADIHLYTAAPADTWHRFADWLATHTARRPLTSFRPVAVSDVLTRAAAAPAQNSTWEATLHPDPATGGPAADTALHRFARHVADAGGIAVLDSAARVGALTYLPIQVPAGTAETVAQFRWLRHLTPMARVTLR